MNIDMNALEPQAAYAMLSQTVLPRPIAWLLTENENSSLNLAPFSYFSPVCSRPPLVSVSVGLKPDGTRKDSWVNLETRGHCVIHIARQDQIEPLNESSRTLPAGASEVDAQALKTVPFEGSPLPRLKEAPVALAGERYMIHEVGDGPQGLLLIRIQRVFLQDDIQHLDGERIKVDPLALNPLTRLGMGTYGALGDIIPMKRPQ